ILLYLGSRNTGSVGPQQRYFIHCCIGTTVVYESLLKIIEPNNHFMVKRAGRKFTNKILLNIGSQCTAVLVIGIPGKDTVGGFIIPKICINAVCFGRTSREGSLRGPILRNLVTHLCLQVEGFVTNSDVVTGKGMLVAVV